MTATVSVSPGQVVQAEPSSGETGYAGLATRLVAFVIDVLLIDLVAAIVGITAALVGALFHFPKDLHTVWVVLGAAAFALWAVGYFVVFWSGTGQTPGARIMQIRVVGQNGEAVKPRRALLRVIGLILAALPVFLGFVPVLFDARRRALQDYLARTVVVRTPQLSVAQAQRARLRGNNPRSGQSTTAT